MELGRSLASRHRCPGPPPAIRRICTPPALNQTAPPGVPRPLWTEALVPPERRDLSRFSECEVLPLTDQQPPPEAPHGPHLRTVAMPRDANPSGDIFGAG